MATSYANSGGQGDRTALITVTSTGTFSGTLDNLVDGAFGNAGDAIFFIDAEADGVYIRFDFGLGVSKVIDEVTWFQNGTSPQGTWKWQGSNDLSGWTDLSAPFTLDAGSGGDVIGDLSANTSGYRAYQIVKTGGTTNDTPWLREAEFKLDDAVAPVHLAGTSTLALTVTGDLTAPGLVHLAGTSTLALTVTGEVTTSVFLAGTSTLALTVSGEITVPEEPEPGEELGAIFTAVSKAVLSDSNPAARFTMIQMHVLHSMAGTLPPPNPKIATILHTISKGPSS